MEQTLGRSVGFWRRRSVSTALFALGAVLLLAASASYFFLVRTCLGNGASFSGPPDAVAITYVQRTPLPGCDYYYLMPDGSEVLGYSPVDAWLWLLVAGAVALVAGSIILHNTRRTSPQRRKEINDDQTL